jgi:hypothetical protein
MGTTCTAIRGKRSASTAIRRLWKTPEKNGIGADRAVDSALGEIGNSPKMGTPTPLPCFLEVLIPNDFKSLFPEVLILRDFKSFAPEVLILAGLKLFVFSEIQKSREILEVLILGELWGFEILGALIPLGLGAAEGRERGNGFEDRRFKFTYNYSIECTIRSTTNFAYSNGYQQAWLKKQRLDAGVA